MNLSDAELKEALFAARVPVAFHDPKHTLGLYGPAGASLKTWVDSGQAAADLGQGMGRFLVGSGPLASDCFFSLARAFTVSGYSVRCFSLPMLARLLGTDEFAEAVSDVSALMVAGFYDPHYAKAFPDDRLYEMEWFFRSRWNANEACLFLSASPITECAWWADGFLKSVSSRNAEVYVDDFSRVTARPRKR